MIEQTNKQRVDRFHGGAVLFMAVGCIILLVIAFSVDVYIGGFSLVFILFCISKACINAAKDISKDAQPTGGPSDG